MISHDKARDGDNVVVLGNGEHNDGGELVGVAAQADARKRAVARHGGGAHVFLSDLKQNKFSFNNNLSIKEDVREKREERIWKCLTRTSLLNRFLLLLLLFVCLWFHCCCFCLYLGL